MTFRLHSTQVAAQEGVGTGPKNI